MDKIKKIQDSLEKEFSDRIILEQLTELLKKETLNNRIMVEDRFIPIEDQPALSVITKLLIIDKDEEIKFAPLRAEVAVGGRVKSSPGNGNKATNFFFATLYYDLGLHLVTVDFHFEKR